MPGPGTGNPADPIKPSAFTAPVYPTYQPPEPVAPETNRLEVEDVVEISSSAEMSSALTIASQDESDSIDVPTGQHLDITG